MDDESTTELEPTLEAVEPIDFQVIMDGLAKIAEHHPDDLTGSMAITQHMMQFDGYDSEGFAAGVCFVKDLISTVMRSAALDVSIHPQNTINNIGQAAGWAAGVAIAKHQTDIVIGDIDEQG